MPLSRSNTIWMRWRPVAGIFHRSAVFNSRICFLLHLTIPSPESDGQRESYRTSLYAALRYRKSLDSISSGTGIIDFPRNRSGDLMLLHGRLLGFPIRAQIK